MALKVTAADLRAYQKFLTDTADELRAELDSLVSEGDSILEGDWQGVSASKFAPNWEEWKKGAQAVVDALDAEAQAVGEAAEEYERQEGENSQSLANIPIDISKIRW